MDFDNEGQVSGNGGCNQYSGGYSVDGNNISIGPLRSTMMACPDEAVGTQESQFLAALDMVETWSLTGEQLVLHGPGETILVSAKRARRRITTEVSSGLGRELARPARLELTTFWSATRCSIH